MATVFGGNGQVITVHVGDHQEALLQSLFDTFEYNANEISTPGAFQFSYSGTTPPTQAINAQGFVSLLDTSTSTGQLIASDMGTMLDFAAPTGSGTVIACGGTDTLNFGSGNWAIQTSGAGTGSIVTLGTGSDTLTMGGNDTVVAGSGSDTIFDGSGAGGVVDGGSGSLLYVGDASPTTVNGGSGTLTAFSGSGTDTYNLGSGFAQIVAGSGITSITGGSTASDFYGSAGGTIDYTGSTNNNLLIAGAGNETLNGASASGSNVFYAGSGDDSLVGGSGNDILFGGSGDSTLVGGAGGNLFAFANQGAGMSTSMDVVKDFTAADSIYLLGGVTMTSGGIAADGTDYQIGLSDGTTITFTGITSIDPSQIHSS